MAPTKKSIYRQPGAQHFQLVHRSVRDPLIHDPEASQQVFKAMDRANMMGKPTVHKSGTTMAELAVTETAKMRSNEGEAALYGIVYDDSQYDYMQHLKPVGEEGAVDSVLLAAPRGSGVAAGMKNQGRKEKGKGKTRDAEDMFQLPESVLPSRYEMSIADVHASQQAIPPELQGLQPDMDPHLRQVLEALDDDAFVDDNPDEAEDVFGQLLGSGELEWDEEPDEFEFAEWGLNDDGTPIEPKNVYGGDDDDDDAKTENGEPTEKVETWEDRFRAFKEAGGKPNAPVSNGGWDSDEAAEMDDMDGGSEAADTVGSLTSQFKDMVVKGGKKRHGKRGPSDASGMSMSSASVYRNQGLRDLDARFDRLEREYELDDDDEYIDDDYDDDVSIAPSYMSTASRVSMFSKGGAGFEPGSPPTISRDDFDAIMDDFLDNYEVVGNRMREAVGTTHLSGAEKLKVLRAALEDEAGVDGISHAENSRRILELERLGRYKVREEKDLLKMEVVQPDKEKWDVETILSTYTNTENHPGMIRMRSKAEAQKNAERRAAAAEARERAAAAAARVAEAEDESDSGSETERETPKVTVARPKGESTEEKKARKAAIKAERASRRAEKKAHKETFGDERKRQIASKAKAVAGGRAADISVTRGVIRM